MPQLFPPGEAGTEAQPKSLSFPVMPSVHDLLELVADLWNEGDRRRGIKRERRWEKASVARRLLLGSLDELGAQVGGWPEAMDAASRKRWLESALRHLPKK